MDIRVSMINAKMSDTNLGNFSCAKVISEEIKIVDKFIDKSSMNMWNRVDCRSYFKIRSHLKLHPLNTTITKERIHNGATPLQKFCHLISTFYLWIQS